MKILKASNFIDYIQKGGTTRPWIILVLDDNKEIPYIVKLTNLKDNKDQHPVFKEVVGNVLAREFSLRVPDMALISFTKDFVDFALDSEQREILSKKHTGLKFSTLYLESAIIYTPSIHRYLIKNYDFANLFAFDVLLYNFDRGRRPEKPNILIENDEFVLIDHELSLPFIDNENSLLNTIYKKLENFEIDYDYKQHLSYPYLKNLSESDKLNLFDEFEELLSKLNVQSIEKIILELHELDISCGFSHRFIEYLYFLKHNSHRFCRALLRCIA